MSGLKIKQEWMQKTVVVWFGALLCCLLWGSAFPCIKIGYRLFEVDAADTASQILFAGCRFTLAGILAAGIGSVMEGRFLRPERKAAKEISGQVCNRLQRRRAFCKGIVSTARRGGVPFVRTKGTKIRSRGTGLPP